MIGVINKLKWLNFFLKIGLENWEKFSFAGFSYKLDFIKNKFIEMKLNLTK